MDINNKKNRSDLKSYFVKNSVPTAGNFAELIDGMLNQKDDGIAKLPGDPLSIEATGDITGLQKVISFYSKLQDANPAWSLQLNPHTDPKQPDTAKAGFGVVDGAGNVRLFIDQGTGNIGVGVVKPNGKLDVAGLVRIGFDEGGSGARSISFARDAGDEGNAGKISYKGGFDGESLNIVGAGAGVPRKIRLWDDVYLTGTLTVNGAITPSVGNSASNGVIFKNNNGGDTSDSAWIRYYARESESTTLEIGTGNDADDHIVLKPSGNVGVGVNNPLYSLDVSASKGIKLGLEGNGGGQLVLANNKDDNKIYLEAFSKDGAGSAAELLLTGKSGGSAPKISLVADVTNITGNLDVEGGAYLGYETLISDFGALLKSGFYEGCDTIIGDVPDTDHPWTHLIAARHSNTTNNHQLQIAAAYASNDKLYFRKIVPSQTDNPSWHEVATRGANVFSGNQTIIDGALTPSAGKDEINGIMFPKNPGGGGGDAAWIRYYARAGESTTLEIGTGNDADDHIALRPSGNVGIGTDNPTKAKLEIQGTSTYNMPLFDYLTLYNSVQRGTVGQYALSLYASDRIAASHFFAFSDERIKNIQGRSDSATDLQTLLGIEITDYRYKDVIGKGNSEHKKVIAQQVERVFPQAVSKHTDVVPDIYEQASFIDGWVELATDLKQGERVRLISDKAEGVYEVLEVAEDKFRTGFKPEGDKVFVFGREVDDFCNVDYDAISMLNVSATQQVKKEMDVLVNAMKAENAALKVRLDALEAKAH